MAGAEGSAFQTILPATVENSRPQDLLGTGEIAAPQDSGTTLAPGLRRSKTSPEAAG